MHPTALSSFSDSEPTENVHPTLWTLGGRRFQNLFAAMCVMAIGCAPATPPASQPEDQDAGGNRSSCLVWYHDCNCTYVCTDERAFNARLENGDGNCDVACAPDAEENRPTEPCEAKDGICQWLTE